MTGPCSALRCVASPGAPQPPRNGRPQHPARLFTEYNAHLMYYIGRVRVSLCWCVPTIVIMESGEDTRVVCIRVCDTCDTCRATAEPGNTYQYV